MDDEVGYVRGATRKLSLDRVAAWSGLAAILITSFLLKLNHLGHLAIAPMDEAFHAVVARNLMDDPFRPMLYADPVLPYDYRDWKSNHVWLHKPPLALWQMAGAMKVLGVQTWSMRLPSALMAAATVGLVYLLGVRLLGSRPPALFAAALASFNPALHTLSQGYIFSDHVDVALLFWTTAAAWLVVRAAQTGRSLDAALAGAMQGLAFLSKAYPALIVSVLVVAAVAMRVWIDGARSADRRFALTWRQFWWFVACAVATAAPWLTYCAIRFPNEFWHEQWHALSHLAVDVEQFAAPWDRLWADYLLRLNHVFYAPLLVAIVLLTVIAWRRRDPRLVFVLSWWWITLIVFTIARSKTPTATIVALPAGWLILAAAMLLAWRGDRAAAVGLGLAVLLGAIWQGEFPRQGWGYATGGRFAGVLRENAWPFVHAGIALAGAAIAVWTPVRRAVGGALLIGCLLVMAGGSSWLFWQYGWTAWRITEQDRNRPAFREVGMILRQRTPPNAVVLVEELTKYEHLMVMFWSARTSYGRQGEGELRATASRLISTGRPVYVVSPNSLEMPLVEEVPEEGRLIYLFR